MRYRSRTLKRWQCGVTIALISVAFLPQICDSVPNVVGQTGAGVVNGDTDAKVAAS